MFNFLKKGVKKKTANIKKEEITVTSIIEEELSEEELEKVCGVTPRYYAGAPIDYRKKNEKK